MKWVVVLILLTLLSCTSGHKDTECIEIGDTTIQAIANTLPEEIPLAPHLVNPEVNLEQQFKSFCNEKGVSISMHPDDPPEHEALWAAVKKLEAYVHGKSNRYPYEELCRILSSMFLEQAYAMSHYGYDEGEEWPGPGRTFTLYFLEQVVRYCPKIEYLTDMHDVDCEVGILNYGAWDSRQPLYSFIIYRTRNGLLEVRSLGKEESVKVTDIQQLEDREGHKCYLLRNYNDTFALFRYKDGNIKRLMCTWE